MPGPANLILLTQTSDGPADAYGQVIYGDDPVAWWRGDDSTFDATGGSAGTLIGATYGTGILPARPGAQSFNLDGTDDYVSIPSQAKLNLAGSLSIEAWIVPDVASGSFRGVAINRSDANNRVWGLQLNSGRPEFVVNAGAGNVRATAAAPVTAGTLYHVVGVLSGSTMTVYVNGTSGGSNTVGALAGNSGLLRIGSWDGASEFFDGRVSEVAVYNRVLTGTEVADHYSAGTAAAIPSSGSGAGTWTFAGAGSGKRTPKATGSGSWSFTGSGAGQTTRSGSGTGTIAFTGSGAGTTTRRGTGTGTIAWTGKGTGSSPRRGSGAGAWSFVGAGTGATVRRGSGSGTAVWTGVGSGAAPAVGVNDGSGSGSWSFTGAGVGKRTPVGDGAGGSVWVGTGVGIAPTVGGHSGSGSGTWAYVGTGTGTAPVVGGSSGSGTGTWAFTGNGTGRAQHSGSGSGTWTFVGRHETGLRDITLTVTPLTARTLAGTVTARATAARLSGRDLGGTVTTRTLDGDLRARALTATLED